MKAKLGKLASVEKKSYDYYKSLLKKEAMALLSDSNANGICDYVLIAGEQLPWEGVATTEEQPLLYLGEIPAWKKEIKAQKMDLKAYSYGTCKLVKVGADIQIALCPEKGKLTQASLLKPIKKTFKKFKPKVFIEVVADLNEVETSTSDTAVLDGEAHSGNELLQSIGPDLQKYHLAVNKIKASIAAAKTEEEKMPLLVKQNQVLRRLKHLCTSWTAEIAPQATDLIVDEEAETWQKIYQKWNAFFEKRTAAKEGKTDDTKSIKKEEKHIYTKALDDLTQFYDNLEKGNLIDPSVIETNIENLEYHLTTWKKFNKGNKSSFSEELNALEKILDNMKTDWAKLKPFAESFQNKVDELEQALEKEDVELSQKLFNELEAINNQITSLN